MTRIKRIYADFFGWMGFGWMVLVDCREKEHRFNGLNGFTRIFLDGISWIVVKRNADDADGADFRGFF